MGNNVALTSQEKMVLLGLEKGHTYAEIGEGMDRSKAWIRELVIFLEKEGFITHEKYKHRSATLTEKGKKYLANMKKGSGAFTNEPITR